MIHFNTQSKTGHSLLLSRRSSWNICSEGKIGTRKAVIPPPSAPSFVMLSWDQTLADHSKLQCTPLPVMLSWKTWKEKIFAPRISTVSSVSHSWGRMRPTRRGDMTATICWLLVVGCCCWDSVLFSFVVESRLEGFVVVVVVVDLRKQQQRQQQNRPLLF